MTEKNDRMDRKIFECLLVLFSHLDKQKLVVLVVVYT